MDPAFSNASYFLATFPAAATLTREAQEERSRLSGTAYGDINSNNLSRPFHW